MEELILVSIRKGKAMVCHAGQKTFLELWQTAHQCSKQYCLFMMREKAPKSMQ